MSYDTNGGSSGQEFPLLANTTFLERQAVRFKLKEQYYVTEGSLKRPVFGNLHSGAGRISF